MSKDVVWKIISFFLYYQTKKNFFRDFSSLQTYEIFSRPRRNPAFAETT